MDSGDRMSATRGRKSNYYFCCSLFCIRGSKKGARQKRSNKIKSISARYLDTMIADGAMRASRRSIKFARDTPFHPHCDSVYFSIFVERRTELIFSVFVGRRCHATSHTKENSKIILAFSSIEGLFVAHPTFRNNARIHERSESEICYHEERYDTLVRGHPWMTKYVVLASSGRKGEEK